MKRTAVSVFLLLGLAACALAGAELFSFRVFPVVNRSQLEWTTGVEQNLRLFVVERSDDAANFSPVGQVLAKGSFSQYEFSDASPLDADMIRTFYYRLKMVDGDGAFRYSEVREVSLSFSAVQHTWGSIKAMFR